MTDEDTFLGLIAPAEEHQRAAKIAIEGLAAERAALARALKGIRKAAGEAVAGAARHNPLPACPKTAVAAFSEVADKASEAANKVNSAARWIGVKAVAFVLGCIVVVVLASWISLAWEHHRVSDLSAEEAVLQTRIVDLKTQIQQLRERAAVWERKAGKATLRSCGPRGRLCVKVDTKAGTFGDNKGTCMIISGY